jgi:nitric oxide reductase NorE protein
MWMFVLFEALIFTGYFGVYLFYRARSPEVYLPAQEELYLSFGIVNTVVLLTSSWSIARSVVAARAGRWREALICTYLTAGLGVLFASIKVAEWIVEVRHGNGFTTNEFFQHYFFLTGIHMVHVTIGLVVLGVIIHQLGSARRRSMEIIETCATYWHTVDFLWVLIFALLYVVR